MTDLHELLDLATDRVEAPGLASGALATAGRRRRNRRAGVVASVAAAVVVAGVATAGWLGAESSPDPAPEPAPSPTQTAPPIATDRIQPVWDPRDAESRTVVDLGVPRVMEELVPGEVDQPVALLDGGANIAYLVSADGERELLDLPEGMARWHSLSLSPDGQRLVAAGASTFFWRDLDGGWRQIDGVPAEAQLTWMPDSSGMIARGGPRVARVDLDSGTVEELPYLQDGSDIAVGADGSVVTTSYSSVREWDDGAVASEMFPGEIGSLARPAVSETSIAAAYSDRGWYGGDRGPADRDGLVALERGTLQTRALVPVPDAATWYSDGGNLTPISWLDDDTVLFTVLPKDAPKEYLMTWDVETGELSRISCWLSSFDAVFATDLLR